MTDLLLVVMVAALILGDGFGRRRQRQLAWKRRWRVS
jgi:hypothetical protein